MRVLICDDEGAQDIIESLDESGVQYEAEALIKERLQHELQKFFADVDEYLSNPTSPEGVPATTLGAADIGLFDNNLTHLKMPGVRLTAEHIVGYIRAFTGLPYAVSLNKNPDVDFDLSYLVGDEETRADLALNTAHLANSGLWELPSTRARKGFRPWYWPQLSEESARREAQVDFVRRHWADPLVDAIELPVDDESLAFLTSRARSALYPGIESDDSGEGKALDEVTCQDVLLASSRSLPNREERVALGDAAASGVAPAMDVAARVVAADLDLWFRRDLLGPQETLVDVPHLLMRMPFLLGRGANDVAAWNRAVMSTSPPFGLDGSLYEEFLEPTRLHESAVRWTAVPSFRWARLKANEDLNELFFEADQNTWADVVFCEDISLFVSRSEARLFTADVDGPWATRYIHKMAGVRYRPLNRLDTQG